VYRKSVRQWTWFAALLTLGLIVYIIVRLERILDHGDAIIPVMWAAGVTYLWWAISKMRAMTADSFMNTAKAKIIADRGVQYCLGPQKLSVSPQQLLLRTTHFDTVQRWTGIDRIDVIDTHLLLVRPDARIFIVPARAFASADHFSAFSHNCRLWLAAHSAGDHLRLCEYLERADVPCPQCSYNLRGCRADRCPECAMPLDRGSIPAAF
jgi:hypothetical protein